MPNPTCSIDECEKLATKRGWCGMHYRRWQRHGTHERATGQCRDCGKEFTHSGPGAPAWKCPACSAVRTTCLTCNGPSPRTLRRDGTYAQALLYCSDACKPRCSVEDCAQPVRKKGWCAAHYSQSRITGDGPKPFVYKWARSGSCCVVCGSKVEPHSGMRRFCSRRCQALNSRTGGSRPESGRCRICSAKIDFLALTKTGQFRRTDTKICNTCRRARATRHRTSVNLLVNRDGNRCGICSEEVDMTLRYPDLFRASVDHVIPYAHGGKNELENFQLAHLWCNQVKRDRIGFKIQRNAMQRR